MWVCLRARTRRRNSSPKAMPPAVVATEKGDPQWDGTVTRAFDELMADGSLAKISIKWFGQDITPHGH